MDTWRINEYVWVQGFTPTITLTQKSWHIHTIIETNGVWWYLLERPLGWAE